MNQLIDRTARGLLPNTVDQRVGVVEKGSQEAARAATQRNKETRQEKLLQEIRDLLRRAGNREPLTVEELAIN
jgi:transcriptional regulator GlxA family with amidase domain